VTLKEVYQALVARGLADDPRGEDGISRVLAATKKEYEDLSQEDRWEFDEDRLSHPFNDTRILTGDLQSEVNRVLAGIDIDTGELLLADRMATQNRPVDLVLAHHPVGRAWAEMADVMDMQADVWGHQGVPLSFGDAVIPKRKTEVRRRTHPANTERSVDAAKILGVALACCHTAADNCVNAFLQKRFDELDQERITLQNVISELKGVPEYTEAVRRGAGPEIVVGEAKHRAGRVMVDMTGGTEGPDQSIQRLAAAGVGTIVGMHMSEDHRKIAEEHHINVVLAGHYASDSLGMNLVLDELERSGVEVEVCSGLIRVSRVE